MELWNNGQLCLGVADFFKFIGVAELKYLAFDYGIWVLSEIPAFWEYTDNGYKVCTKGD